MVKKLRCKKEFGEWFYDKIEPNDLNCLDATIYMLHDKNGGTIEFGSYGDMKYYVETGIILV